MSDTPPPPMMHIPKVQIEKLEYRAECVPLVAELRALNARVFSLKNQHPNQTYYQTVTSIFISWVLHADRRPNNDDSPVVVYRVDGDTEERTPVLSGPIWTLFGGERDIAAWMKGSDRVEVVGLDAGCYRVACRVLWCWKVV